MNKHIAPKLSSSLTAPHQCGYAFKRGPLSCICCDASCNYVRIFRHRQFTVKKMLVSVRLIQVRFFFYGELSYGEKSSSASFAASNVCLMIKISRNIFQKKTFKKKVFYFFQFPFFSSCCQTWRTAGRFFFSSVSLFL